MSNEENKPTNIPEETPAEEPATEPVVEPAAEPATDPVEEIDEDFADAVPYVPAEEAKEEEPAAAEEPEISEEVVEQAPEEPNEVPPIEEQFSSEYDDRRLESIEAARIIWNKAYKKMSRIKFVVSIFILLGILAGWLIPTILIKDQGSMPLFIGLGIAVVGIVALFLFGYFQRRHDKGYLQDYFNSYFGAVNDYTLGDLGVANIEGSVDSKITKEEFLEGGAFDDAASVGSRDNIVFNYKGMDCAMAEAAAQKDAGKALQTIFVGKFLRTHNNVEVGKDGLILYFMGNDRSLPPKKLETLHLCENGSKYRVYGASSDKKILTKKVRDTLAKIRTDKLLVDVTVAIQNGRTYWYLGYEDDIMILPNDKPFDPRYVKKYKEQIEIILEAALALNQ